MTSQPPAISIDWFTSHENFHQHVLPSSECYLVNNAVVSFSDSLYQAGVAIPWLLCVLPATAAPFSGELPLIRGSHLSQKSLGDYSIPSGSP